MSKVLLDKISWFILLRVLAFELVVLLVIILVFENSKIEEFNYSEILNLLVRTIAIIAAIIITFLLSKLFAEKAERIKRKHEIDELSYKVTAFRKIAFHIKGMYEFWKQSAFPVKSMLEGKYKSLTYHQYRNELGYEVLTRVNKEIGGTTGQAYLALKGLENNENTFAFFQTFRPINYSLENIADFKEYSGSFWSFLDRNGSFDFKVVNTYELDMVSELYFKIMGTIPNTAKFRDDIKNLFALFEGEVFDKLFYLTSLNSKLLPKLFMSSFINLVIFILILICSLIAYSVNLSGLNSYIITILTIAIFIANTIDLIVILIAALKQELTIKDFYKI